MKNFEVLKLTQFLNAKEAQDLVLSIKANIALQKNIPVLREELRVMGEVEKKVLAKSDRFSEFEKIKKKLESDFEGEEDLGKKNNLQRQFNDVVSEYEDEIVEQNKKINEWKNFLEEPSSLDLMKISLSDIKNESMSKAGFEALSLLIEEDE